MSRIFGWLMVAALVVVRLHNARVTPAHHSFDNYGHLWYLQMSAGGQVPLPNQGWQNYHPPLFYWLSGRLGAWFHQAAVPTAQWISTVAGLLRLLVVGLIARQLVPRYTWFAVVTAAALPIDVITAATVYNLSFAYFWCALFLWLMIGAWQEARIRVWREVLLGLVAAAGAMSRPDGAILLVLLGALWLGRMVRTGRVDATLSAFLSGMVALAGVSWFWLRNLADFGRPFVFPTDWDMYPNPMAVRSDFAFLPGFHSLAFYFLPDLRTFAHPRDLYGFCSLPSILYASIWWRYSEAQRLPSDPYVGPLLLVLGLLPTVLMLVGLRQACRRPSTWWPVLASVLATVAFYTTMLLKDPIWGAVKGLYLYTCFPAFLVCVAAGTQEVVERWPKARPLLYVGFFAMAGVSGWTNWYPG
ncbi:MAG TPA: hypothetical protein VGO93_00955 [Candidatus Xenobia bacterium]